MVELIDENNVNNECSNKCADVLTQNIDISIKFIVHDTSFILQRLSTYDLYLEARKLISNLTRCSMTHNERFINELLKSKLFYPITISLLDDDNNLVKGGVLVGYFEIYLLPHMGRTFDGRIERVVVHPKYQNMGICQKMMKLGIDLCKNNLMCNRIDLYAETDSAIHIYTKLGFTQVDTNVYRLTLIPHIN